METIIKDKLNTIKLMESVGTGKATFFTTVDSKTIYLMEMDNSTLIFTLSSANSKMASEKKAN